MSEQAKQTIKELIAKNMQTENKRENKTNNNKFDFLMQEIEKYIEGATAHNMTELKAKANDKKKKGDLFEAFCFLYLEIVLNHEQVWFYKDFPKELKDQFDLTKNDFGIDLLSKKGDHYYAIQCKYKKPQDKVQIISWRALSTFYAMVVKTGPWLKHITMTNVNGCKHIGKKTEKDWSICIGTFRKINHFMWLKMSNSCVEKDKIPEGEIIIENQIITDKEVIRNKRLAYFSSNTTL